MKKLLKFTGLLILVAGLSFGASMWWSRRVEPVVIDRFNSASAEYVPSTTKGSVKLTNEEASFSFLIPGREELRYYVSRTGEIKSVNLQKLTDKPKLVATIKPRAIALTWSPDGTRVIATYGSDHIATNLATGVSTTLDRKITAPEFARDSNQVAYLYFDPKTEIGNIAIADAQFNNFKSIIKTRLKNWELQWSTGRRLSLIATAADTKLNTLFLLDTDNGSLESLVDSKSHLETNWSPDGNYVLYSRLARKGLELFLYDVIGKNNTQLKLPGIASKCAWTPDSKILYCAVPEKPIQPSDSNGSEDTFVKINPANPSASPEKIYAAADASFVDARELHYAPIQQAIVFKNFKDGRLYLLPLAR